MRIGESGLVACASEAKPCAAVADIAALVALTSAAFLYPNAPDAALALAKASAALVVAVTEAGKAILAEARALASLALILASSAFASAENAGNLVPKNKSTSALKVALVRSSVGRVVMGIRSSLRCQVNISS